MGEISQSLKFPTRGNILWLNRRHLENTGGEFFEPENLLNPNSLEWVLEAIQYPLFGEALYPTMVEKSAILGWTIIDGHVFYDGNKRTGMAALEIFLKLNGYYLDATNDEMEKVAICIASAGKSNYSYDEFVQWVRGKIQLENALLSR